MWVLAGIVGVFLAVDLFLFYFAWELMLIPMYFLIVIWGHERRVYAAMKFFLFTQFSGLLMLIAILALYFIHHQATGVYTFEYSELLGTQLSPGAELWIMLGFFVAFAVKLPVVPLHTWLPDAHTEAPTAGSVILAGLLLKTGAYGLLRFVIPLFPHAAHEFTPVALVLAVIGIVYGAVMAFSQTDLKRLVAYTSVSHLGFVLLGIFSWNPLALQGAIMTMICHGLSTGALFILVGGLQERIHTRDLERMGGLWTVAPRLSGAALFFSLASLGLPGLGDFVGEFLVLLGSYKISVTITVVASLGDSRVHVLCACAWCSALFKAQTRTALATPRSHAAGRTHDGGDDCRPAVAGILSAAGAQHLCAGYGQFTARGADADRGLAEIDDERRRHTRLASAASDRRYFDRRDARHRLQAQSCACGGADPRRTGRRLHLDLCGRAACSPASDVASARGPICPVLHGPDHRLRRGCGSAFLPVLRKA